jgi:xylulokinase
VWAKTRYLFGAAGYLLYQLTGEAAIDIYDATGYPPLFDMHQQQWSAEMAPLLAPLDMLPRLTWTCEIAGHVQAQAAQITGLAAGTPVITGTADAASEAISAGLTRVGDLMVMYGSSIFFILKHSHLHTSPVFSGAPFLEPNTFVVTGAMSTAGTLTKWFRDQLAPLEVAAEQAGGENAYAVMAALAADAPCGANGLVVLPHFAGARTPQPDPEALGAIFGLTLRHTRADIYRAILEAIGYGIRHNIDALAAEGVTARRILAVGGGSLNSTWMQIVSDIANVEQHIPHQQIGAAYGDAFLAGIGVGLFKSTAEATRWVTPKAIIRPDPAAHEFYTEYYQLYRDLYQQTAESMHRLSRLQH